MEKLWALELHMHHVVETEKTRYPDSPNGLPAQAAPVGHPGKKGIFFNDLYGIHPSPEA